MHNDFTESNCIVDNDKIVGLIDWEMAGFFGWKTTGEIHRRVRTPQREHFANAHVSEEVLQDIMWWGDLYDDGMHTTVHVMCIPKPSAPIQLFLLVVLYLFFRRVLILIISRHALVFSWSSVIKGALHLIAFCGSSVAKTMAHGYGSFALPLQGKGPGHGRFNVESNDGINPDEHSYPSRQTIQLKHSDVNATNQSKCLLLVGPNAVPSRLCST